MCLQEYFLAKILGIVTVPGHIVRDPVYRDLVTIDNLPKGIDISLFCTFDDDVIF